MQALYAYYQSDSKDLTRTEQELLNSTDRIYDLYLAELQFFLEISHQEDLYYEDAPASLVTGIKRTASSTLKDLAFISWLKSDAEFNKKVKSRKISWQNDLDPLKKVFAHLRQQETYKEFTSTEGRTPEQQRTFIKWMYKEMFHTGDILKHLLEEKNIYWAESLDLVETMFLKTAENPKTGGQFSLLPLYKDEDDDIRFMRDLVQKTIRDDGYFQQLIADKTKNWDTERIALVDIILMKMALCEILNIENIPVKVSINEYIDISKDYSTPNSKGFINGVIDKLVIELRQQGKIHKTGRGLIE